MVTYGLVVSLWSPGYTHNIIGSSREGFQIQDPLSYRHKQIPTLQMAKK